MNTFNTHTHINTFNTYVYTDAYKTAYKTDTYSVDCAAAGGAVFSTGPCTYI